MAAFPVKASPRLHSDEEGAAVQSPREASVSQSKHSKTATTEETTSNAEVKSPVKVRQTLQVFVRGLLLPKTLCLQVDPESQVSALKNQVQEASGIQPENQHLYIGRNFQLCDLLSIRDHGIQQDQNIKLRAGGLLGGGPFEEQLRRRLFLNLSGKLGPKWKTLAIYLGFSEEELNAFEYKTEFERHGFRMLDAWWKKQDNPADALEQLKDALKAVGRTDLALQVTGTAGTSLDVEQCAGERAAHYLETMKASTHSERKHKAREIDDINVQTQVVSANMCPSVIHRSALGRVAKIGALYDIRTESFLGDTLFGSKLKDDAVDTMDLGDTSIELVMSDNIQEKFNKLNVEVELQVSLLAGLIKLSGSGSYLGEERKSARAQSMSLIYKLRTFHEEIMLRQNKDKIDLEILSPSNGQTVNATHVVYAIDWGAVCSVTCECENKYDENVTEVKRALSAEIEKIKGLVDFNGSTKTSYDDKNKGNHNKFTFECKADVSAPSKDLPVTFEGAVQLARNIPSLVKGTNKGKGVPLLYMLMPLDAVVKMCRLQIQLQIQYTSINDDIIKKCAQVVEGITKQRQSLYDIQNDLHASAEYVAEKSLARIDDILNKFVVQESVFKSKLQDLVKKTRSGIVDVSEIEAFLDKELSGAFSIFRYNDYIRVFQKDLNKLKSIKSWKKKGIIYIGKKDEVIVDDSRMVYVLYKTGNENVKNDLDEKNREFFLRLQKAHAHDEDYKFIVVDQDLREDIWPSGEKKTTIHSFVNSVRTSEDLHSKEGQDSEMGLVRTSVDLHSKEGQDSEMCLIHITISVPKQIRPHNRTFVKMMCPNALARNGQCSGDPVAWKCSKCRELVEYGIETKLFYCKCGESEPNKSFWRCNEKNHGINYVKYQHDIPFANLSNLPAQKERNILILGETGVGKSTWINSFMNYIYYADLEEAMNAKEFQILIPSSFTFTHQGKEKKIMVGESDTNEKMEAGKSATKETRSYVFQVGGDIIRLIDTPGIGETAGIQQDRKNFDNILSYLTHYQEIHAVCILLHPNKLRLTAMFRFCIQELLAHLHSSAKNNIVFCFTNARATFYEPGDTLPALNKELHDKQVRIKANPNNYFCFDNEPFRFLACVKHGVKFSRGEIDTYAKSWNRSVEETKRLFKHISSLTPHEIRNTSSINEARRIIVAMSKPLAEVAKIIHQNVLEGNEAKTQIYRVDRDMDSLKANRTFLGFDLKRVELDHPKTVCSDSECVLYVPIGASSTQNIIYEQICHDHCTCIESGSQSDTRNDARLQHCLCIDRTTLKCKKCGHHYTTHMHMTYDLEVFPMEFRSEEVQTQINQKKSTRETKKAFKEAIDTKIGELKKEENTIVKTSAKYGSYLKANALIPYNDAVGDYLDMVIAHERNKAKEIQNPTFVTTMEDMKRQYEHERKILDKAIDEDGGENIHTPEEVIRLLKELFGLKHMGQTLKDLYDGISISHSARNMAFQEKIAPIPQNYRIKEEKSSWDLTSLVATVVDFFK